MNKLNRNEISGEGTIRKKVKFSGAIYHPSPDNKSVKFPLIVYLGPMGQHLESKEHIGCSIYQCAPIKYRSKIVFGSLCGNNHIYDPDSLFVFIEKIKAKYENIDKDRVYLAGFSYGGRWVYNCAFQYPNLFAALMVFSGYSNYIAGPRISHIPTYIIHDIDDMVVPVEEAYKMIYAYPEEIVRYEIFKKGGHGGNNDYLMSNPETYEWLLSKNRKDNNARKSAIPHFANSPFEDAI